MDPVGTYTATVNQNYLIEPLKGAGHPSTYLDRFPDNVFNTSPDSILYKLIYTLIGPAGVASLKRGYFEARLKFEEMGLEQNELEKFYANPMGFGRIASEIYSEVPTGLLNNDIWTKVKSQDQAYRNRVLDFLHACRLGGTVEGMRYAAKSALGQDVDIIESYYHIFDQNSDQIVGFPNIVQPGANGIYSTEKFGILPKPETSSTALQTIKFDPIPDSGSFTITYNGETVTIPVIVTNYDIQNALSKMKSIQKNVIVSGSIDTAINIQFVGELTNHDNVDLIVVDPSNAYKTIGVESRTPCDVIVESNSGYISPNTETSGVSAALERNLEDVMDKVRPVTSYPVLIDSRSNWHQLIFNDRTGIAKASSEYAKVLRYVTGNNTIPWPKNDPRYWIKSNEEVEAPSIKNDFKETYQNFHNYTLSANYKSVDGTVSSAPDYQIGRFSDKFVTRIPSFSNFNKDTTTQFTVNKAIALHYKPRTVTSVDSSTDTPLIDGIYPSDYQNLLNNSPTQLTADFWASAPNADGTDYLEIDFGKVRAINFISLEVLKTPLTISIEYDLDLGDPAQKHYSPVTPEFVPGTTKAYDFDTEIFYFALDPAPWQYLTYNFRDSDQNMIYTRYIRIGFTRRTSGNSNNVQFLSDSNGKALAWNVCVRNLRLGRNV